MPGVVGMRCAGNTRADVQVAAPEELRNDMVWGQRALELRPSEGLHFSVGGVVVWHPRLSDLWSRALSIGPEPACAVYTDAASSRGWEAALGDMFFRGVWPKVAMSEGSNWKQLWVLKEALCARHTHVKRKLVLARRVADANHGAGRSGQLPRLAREIKEYETMFDSTGVALHIVGKDNSVRAVEDTYGRSCITCGRAVEDT